MKRKYRNGILSVALIGMAVCTFTLMARRAEARHCAAIVYEDANYQGRRQCLQVGSYNLEDLGIRNDSLSSIKVSAANTVILFQHKNFSGNKYIIHHDHSYIGDKWNDQVSSIIVE